MAVKAYTIGNYFYLEFTDTSVIISDLLKDVEIRLLNSSPATYYFFSDGIGEHQIALTDLQDRSGNQYTQAGFEAYYQSLTGAVTPMTYKQSVSRGLVPGVSILEAFGERTSIGTTVTGEDIWRGTATTVPVPDSVGEAMYIVSDDAQDTLAGTGVQKVEIHYLTEDGTEAEVIVDMAGATPVLIPYSTIRFINYIHSTQVGSNGVAEGNITVYKSGAPTTIYSFIELGGNMCLLTNRMIPKGKTFYPMNWHAEEAQGKRIAFRIRSTQNEGVIISGVFIFMGAAYLKLTTSGSLDVDGGPLPELTIIKISGWAAQTGAEGSAGYWGYLVDNNI